MQKKLILLLLILSLVFSSCYHYEMSSIQDYQLIDGKYTQVGKPYPVPATITNIHGFNWIKVYNDKKYRKKLKKDKKIKKK